MNNSHEWSLVDSFKITPFMRDLMLFGGQEDNYKASSKYIQKYLGVKADDSQIHRLCIHYGEILEEEMEELEGQTAEYGKKFSASVKENEVVYSMLDGCMLPTRPQQTEKGEKIGSWKEMKLGRVFKEQDHLDLGNKANIIRKSLYVSHFGNSKTFVNKLELIVDNFESLSERLVFINDGATWIANWIKGNYPKATDILDFYHAMEYLHDFSKIIFSKKAALKDKQEWVEQQSTYLLEDKIEMSIENIKLMDLKGKVKLKAQQRILTYLSNNKHRMFYKTYKDRGLLIGSGPIESAHRFVLQKRMKQSGQKWTKKGGQAIANLRVINLNNQWNRVISLINKSHKNAA